MSELFTQDLEESLVTPNSPERSRDQRPQSQRPAAESQAEAAPADPAAASRPIDPQQLKQLWSRVTQHSVDHEAFRTYLAQLGLQSTKQLTEDQLTQCLCELDTWQGQAFQPHDNTDAEMATQAQGTRAHLFETLSALQAEIAELERRHAPEQPHDPALMELAQWLTNAAQVCSNPDTPEVQLANT